MSEESTAKVSSVIDKEIETEETQLKERMRVLRDTRRPRQVLDALERGMVPQGVRLVDPANSEEGVTFVLTPEEAPQLVEKLSQIAKERLANLQSSLKKTAIISFFIAGALLSMLAYTGLAQGAALMLLGTIQLSVSVRNGMLDALETAVGTSAVIKLKSGAPPANCAAADSGTVIATISLASDWMSAASSGSKAFSSTPLSDASADNAGTLGHYRVYASDGTTCHLQGTITATGGGGDMTVDNTSVTAGQQVNITSWTIAMAGHA